MAAAHNAGSFSFVDRYGSGTQAQSLESLVGESGDEDAQQTLSEAGDTLDVRLVNEVAYIRAGSEVLGTVLGLPGAVASTEAGKWLSVTRRDKGYAKVVKSVRPDAELDSYIPQEPLVLGPPSTLHGIRVLPVSGAAPPADETGALNVRVTLFVSTVAPYLPIGGAMSGTDVHGRPQHNEVAFSHWGEHIKTTVPPGALPVTSLAS